jgi:hypothetical protein
MVMLEQILKSLAVVSIGCLALCGCAHFTKSGRQQLAYEKYVRKQSGIRLRQKTKMKPVRVPTMTPSEPKVNTSVSDSPQSVTSGEGENN